MKKALLKIIVVFATLTLLMVLWRPVFMTFYRGEIAPGGAGDWLAVILHGVRLDMAIAGYLTVVPALTAIVALCGPARVAGRVDKVYYCIISVVLASVFVVDLVLYGYWDFRLDMTPVFYFMSSPSSAFASADVWMILGGIAAMLLVAAAYALVLIVVSAKINVTPVVKGRPRTTAVAVTALATAALFIPIRGGFTVSTMNLSTAYFSSNQRLNHAAINPVFSLLYSATHQSNFGSQFRYYAEDEAEAVVARMKDAPAVAADSTARLLTTDRPDIYIIILESFSSHLMPSLGGEAVATRLDSVARAGVSFTDFYANSFRTDRGLPSILSGFPGLPTTSVMKSVEKAERLPSIAAELKRQAGYDARYYYGGDANFTNMQAYLVSGGYDPIVSDKDFPVTQRLSKWGAHDDVLFARVLRDLPRSADAPRLTVVQTSSSHEPFDVPRHDPRFEAGTPLNAFAFTDAVVAEFLDSLKRSPRYDRTLVVLVPDHQGAYPTGLEGATHHHVPMVWTGGAVAGPLTVSVTGSQMDIAATLLARLGLDHSAFEFSKDMLNPASPHFAFYSTPSTIGVKNVNGEILYNIESESSVIKEEKNTSGLEKMAKSMLQVLYTRLDELGNSGRRQ